MTTDISEFKTIELEAEELFIKRISKVKTQVYHNILGVHVHTQIMVHQSVSQPVFTEQTIP